VNVLKEERAERRISKNFKVPKYRKQQLEKEFVILQTSRDPERILKERSEISHLFPSRRDD
jgi:hypothetical protein